MNIVSYIHPSRTYLPCSGAGRHINNSLLGLSQHSDVKLKLLFAKQWLLSDGRLPANCPLRDIPYLTFPMQENRTERMWKLFDFPKMDKYIPPATDWVFTPMESYVPLKNTPLAITLFDLQAFEPDLPWSQTWEHRLFRYKWGRWVKKAIDNSRVVFTISEFTKSRMVDLLGADPEKIVNVGCGVEKPFFDVRQQPIEIEERPTAYPYVLMIGGLRQKKGGDYFLQIAQKLQEVGSRIHIVIAGSSDETYVTAARSFSNIILLGLVADEALPRLIKGSVCLLFLSLYEGFGIPALEAMAAGVPSVVSNRASLPEVVGRAGIVVDPTDTIHVVQTIVDLETNTAFREEVIARGTEHVGPYQWQRTANIIYTTLSERL